MEFVKNVKKNPPFLQKWKNERLEEAASFLFYKRNLRDVNCNFLYFVFENEAGK